MELSTNKITAGDEVVLMMVVRDLSAGKLAEEALKESEEKFRLISEQSLMGIAIIQDEVIKYANQAFARISGYSIEEVLAWGPGESAKTIHPDDRRHVMDQSSKKQTGNPDVVTNYEYRGIGKDGRLKWIEVYSGSIMYGSMSANLMTFTDITERKKAVESLKESEKQYRLLAENASDVIFTLGMDLKYTYISPSIFKLRGFAPSEVLNLEITKTLTPGSLEKAGEMFRNEMAIEEAGNGDPDRSLNIELEMLCKDGSTVWTEVVVSFVRDQDGKPTGIIGVTRDISRQRKAQMALQESNDRFRELTELLPGIIFEMNNAGDLTFVNQAAIEQFGYSQQDFENGMNIINLVADEDKERTIKNMMEIMNAERLPEFREYTAVRKNGQTFPIIINSNVIYAGGRPVGFRGFAIDISERKISEEALRESESKYRTILEDIKEGYYETDLYGNFTFFNESLANIMGYPEEELMGMNTREYTADDWIDRILSMGREVYETGKPALDKGSKIITKNGEIKFIEMSVSLVCDQAGEAIGHRGVVRDVTEEKRADDAQKRIAAAEAANQAKSDFLANMSHEIRTPLNGLIGMTDLLMETGLQDDQKLYVDVLYNSADSLLNVINDILDYTKIEAGRLDIEPIPFELLGLIEETINILTLKAEKKGLELIFNYRPRYAYTLNGDAGRIKQIIMNLLSNAIKFTEEGFVLVDVQAHEVSPSELKLEINIQDTGVGIPEDEIDHVFEKFAQADASTTRKHGGTGLGLAISQELAGLMGAKITASSKADKGSTFSFCITLEICEGGSNEIKPDDDIDIRKILVVDSSAQSAAVFKDYYIGWGIECVTAASTNRGLELLKEAREEGAPFQAAVLDNFNSIQLDAVSLAREIKADDKLKNTKLIISGPTWIKSQVEVPGGNLFSAYLIKPAFKTQMAKVLNMVSKGRTKTEQIRARASDLGKTPSAALPIQTQSDDRSKYRILLVEDNEANQKAAVWMLEKLDCKADIASNGAEAVEMVAHDRYDLVFMDLQMPEVDGFEATARIRKMEYGSRRHIPIVAMTANAMQADREHSLKAGMDGYISKPVRKKDLENVLERFIGTEVPDFTAEAGPSMTNYQAPQNLPVFDRETALERFDNEKEILKSIIIKFIQTAPKHLGTIREGLEKNDSSKVFEAAHTLKGAASYVGAERVKTTALEIEMSGRDEKLAPVEVLFEQVCHEMDAFETAVEGF